MMLMVVQIVSIFYFEWKLMSFGIFFLLWIVVVNEWCRLIYYYSEVYQEMFRYGQILEWKGKWQYGLNEGREQFVKMVIFGEV